MTENIVRPVSGSFDRIVTTDDATRFDVLVPAGMTQE